MPGEMCVKISIKNDSIDNGLGVYYRTSDGNTEAPPPPHEEEEEKNGKNILYVCMYILYDVFLKEGIVHQLKHVLQPWWFSPPVLYMYHELLKILKLPALDV